MHEHYEIIDRVTQALSRIEFILESENNDLDTFGSIESTYICGDKRFRFRWDGEEGFESVGVWNNGQWQTLLGMISESDEVTFQRTTAQLVTDIQEYCRSDT